MSFSICRESGSIMDFLVFANAPDLIQFIWFLTSIYTIIAIQITVYRHTEVKENPEKLLPSVTQFLRFLCMAVAIRSVIVLLRVNIAFVAKHGSSKNCRTAILFIWCANATHLLITFVLLVCLQNTLYIHSLAIFIKLYFPFFSYAQTDWTYEAKRNETEQNKNKKRKKIVNWRNFSKSLK